VYLIVKHDLFHPEHGYAHLGETIIIFADDTFQTLVSGSLSSNPCLPLPRARHPTTLLQWPTPARKQPIIFQMQEDIRTHPRSKIDSSNKLPMRKKMKNVVGQAEEPETENEDTPRDHLLTVEDFRDTSCMRNSRGKINSFWVGGDQ
jgi:hypothetical protein